MSEKKTLLEELKILAKSMPELPGVYRYLDGEENVIYVGKAKNLKKRVLSYFTKKYDNNKTAVLVKNIRKIKHFVVETETDALLLENNLIKKYRPRYNILLKDDKSYPWICIKNEPFPRVFQTRNVIKDGSDYFGPYTSVRLVRILLEMFKKLFQLRTCKLNLSEGNIQKGKYKVCLDYHLGNCKAPCVQKQELREYDEHIIQIKNILKGNTKKAIQFLTEKMQEYAQNLEFEKAQTTKENLDLLKEYQIKSTVVSPSLRNIDVFSIINDDKNAFVNFLKIVNGSIIQVHTAEIKKKLDETKEDLLSFAITDFIQTKMNGFTNAEEFIVSFPLDFSYEKVKITVPQIGDKKKLLELSERNLKYYKLEKLKHQTLIDPQRHAKRIMRTMQADLRLQERPIHIECFDNSNIQGTNPVAACVVFRHGKPAKKDYRKFKIKTVEGPDDFASMEEIIYRRYKRLLDEKQDLPQLIIVDGGKGQLSAALKSLEKLNLRGKIAIIGIAKRLEEIYFPGDSVPLYLDKNSETLKIIQFARNEAHRFGITFHRNKRSEKFIKSELENIKGIGEGTAIKLLQEFKTVKAISKLKLNEIEISIGKSKAKLIFDYFEQKMS